jgi:hypothetical protein
MPAAWNRNRPPRQMQPKWSNTRPTTFPLRKYFNMVIQSLARPVLSDRHERKQITRWQEAGESCVLMTTRGAEEVDRKKRPLF